MPQVIKTEITIVQEGKDSFKKESEPFSFVRRREKGAEERRNRSTRSDKTPAYAEERKRKEA
jgi:hypothetical protein